MRSICIILLLFFIFGCGGADRKIRKDNQRFIVESVSDHEHKKSFGRENGDTNSDWLEAMQINTVEGYQDFLRIHPEGIYTEDAKSRILEIMLTSDSYSDLKNDDCCGATDLKSDSPENYSDIKPVEHQEKLINPEKNMDSGYNFKIIDSGKTTDIIPQNKVMDKSFSSEKEAWIRAQRINTVEAYQSFLRNYPDGQYDHEAKSSILKVLLGPDK